MGTIKMALSTLFIEPWALLLLLFSYVLVHTSLLLPTTQHRTNRLLFAVLCAVLSQCVFLLLVR